MFLPASCIKRCIKTKYMYMVVLHVHTITKTEKTLLTFEFVAGKAYT